MSEFGGLWKPYNNQHAPPVGLRDSVASGFPREIPVGQYDCEKKKKSPWFFLSFKPSGCENITLHALPSARYFAFLVSAFLAHGTLYSSESSADIN